MNKKAQGLPLNTIVIAIIVLVILVVLILIFGGQTKLFTGGVKNCASSGGVDDCFSDCDLNTVNSEGQSYPAGTLLVNVPGTNCDDREDGKTKCCKVVYEPETQT